MAASHFTGSGLAAFAEVLAVGLKDLIDKCGAAKNRSGRDVADPAT